MDNMKTDVATKPSLLQKVNDLSLKASAEIMAVSMIVLSTPAFAADNPVNDMFNKAGISEKKLGGKSGNVSTDAASFLTEWTKVVLLATAFVGIIILAFSIAKFRKSEQQGGDTKSATMGIFVGGALIGLPFIIGIIMWLMA